MKLKIKNKLKKINKKFFFGLVIILLGLIFLIFYQGSSSSLDYKNSLDYKDYEIYDIHEHIAQGNLDTLLYAMEENNISKTVLLGSPKYTLTLKNPGFEDFESNNDYLTELSKSNPVIAFCTIDTRKDNSTDVLKNCLDQGGKGLKLYSGHYASYYDLLGPLNRSEVVPVYNYCEENNVPIVFHVNPYYQKIKNEFEDVLETYPEMVVDCPHWCLSSINDERFRQLYDDYPNLYTDISFGSRFAQEGLERISKNPDKYRDIILEYQDRFMFGTDLVLTSVKSEKFATEMISCYRKMLEKERYECNVEGIKEDFSIQGEFNGLNLSEDVLKKIYNENPKRFLQGKIAY